MTLCEVAAREVAQTLLISLAPTSCLHSLWYLLGTPSSFVKQQTSNFFYQSPVRIGTHYSHILSIKISQDTIYT